jgi:magnesium transporter
LIVENNDQREKLVGGAPTLDGDYALNPDFVREVCDVLDGGNGDRARELFFRLHSADQADLLGLVRPSERRDLIKVVGRDLDPEVLSDLDEDIKSEVIGMLPAEDVAAAVKVLESDDGVAILEKLDDRVKAEILEQVPDVDRAAVEFSLQYPEESAGRLMRREFMSVPPFWTVAQTFEYLKAQDELPDMFFEIFVVDPSFHAIGTMAVSKLISAGPETLVGDIMSLEQTLIPAMMDEEEVAYLFKQYHLVSAAVIDQDERVVGMITVDDIVNVVQETASEDMLALAGVREAEGLSDSVIATTRSRFSWLFVNLLTAISASIVIALFYETIEKAVALAVLMPIVASMGGNAGTQTLTVAVRALATKDLTPTNAMRIVTREVLVGGLNGILFAVLMGLIGGIWFGSLSIGIVLGLAMVINLLFAGLAGILVPLGLDRVGIDPALASTVFVTTVTDIVGFFVFLGLATLMFV